MIVEHDPAALTMGNRSGNLCGARIVRICPRKHARRVGAAVVMAIAFLETITKVHAEITG